MSSKNISVFESALPEMIPFYHLGVIERASEEFFAKDRPARRAGARRSWSDSDLEDMQVIGFFLRGDIRAVMLVAIEKSLDASVYSEAGNIIASRFVTQLAAKESLDVILSPPTALNEDQLRRLAHTSELMVERVYVHRHETQIVPVRTLLVSDSRAAFAKPSIDGLGEAVSVGADADFDNDEGAGHA